MKFDNYKITVNLLSPLCGAAPRMDAMLSHTIANDSSKHKFLCKGLSKKAKKINIDKYILPDIPLDFKIIEGIKIYCCSHPIFKELSKDEYQRVKKTPRHEINNIISNRHRKDLTIEKSRTAIFRVRLIKKIIWFIRGNIEKIKIQLIKNKSLGKNKKYGYGIVGNWEFENIEKDYSIFAQYKNKKILMRVIPAIKNSDKIIGYDKQYGGVTLPYWHPDNQMEILYPR